MIGDNNASAKEITANSFDSFCLRASSDFKCWKKVSEKYKQLTKNNMGIILNQITELLIISNRIPHLFNLIDIIPNLFQLI